MSLSPQQLKDLHRQAEHALLAGQPREAHRHCLKILKADRHHADAWFICGVIAGQNNQFEKAVQILGNACTLKPDRAEYHAELGKYLLAVNRSREALETALKAAALAPLSIATLNTLGTVFSHCGEHERAIQYFAKAVGEMDKQLAELQGAELQTPEHSSQHSDANRSTTASYAEIHFNMAVSLQFAGRIDDAEQAFERAIDMRPDYLKAHAALATLRRQTKEHNHLARLEKLREKSLSSIDRVYVGHALAKEQEDLGDFDAAINCLAWAKGAYAREVNYRFDEEQRLFECLKNTFTREMLSRPTNSYCPNNEPIFIVGMPRTGTTLVEQILGGHSQVFAAGELQQFPHQVAHFCGTSNRTRPAGFLDIKSIQASVDINHAALGRAYIEATRPRTGQTPHFSDKLPRNFLYLGLIRQALPNAKIVCLRRDPMDTCLSNYRQLFAVNAHHYHYNLDLETCARYFIQFDLLMRHWHEVMPGAVYELSYEALVNNPPSEVAGLLEFCGLAWEERCLDFHRRDNAVATPSAVQVKQGIYNTSIGRWRRYGDAMQPLYDLLHDAGYCD